MAEEFITHSPEETEQVAEAFAATLKKGDVVAYRGPMGAGKTAFTRGVARHFGAYDQVSSPTFALVNEYRGDGVNLFHFDMYRVGSFDDLYSTGFFDYLEEDGILLIEWSENIGFALAQPVTVVTLEALDDTTRRILIERDKLLTEEGLE